MGSWTYNVAARFFRISKVNEQICVQFYTEMCPWWSIIVLAKNCCRKILHQSTATSIWRTFSNEGCHGMAPQGIMVNIYMSTLNNTHEIKYVWLAIKINYFEIPAPVGVSYVATQFHASNSDGRMSKCVKTSQRCEWLNVTSRNVSSKINVKPSKVQIPISFLIIWIFWSNKNELTLHIMTCLKIT